MNDAASQDTYLELLKRCLTGEVHQHSYTIVRDPGEVLSRDVLNELKRKELEPARRVRGEERRGLESEGRGGWPLIAETMIGRTRLENVQHCVEDVLDRGVPGDLIEAGVWRGGTVIFMRALLAAYGVDDRNVWVADSFRGLPRPDPDRYPEDEGDEHHRHRDLAVTADAVRGNFRRYGLLDRRVKFLEGWFRDTLAGLGDIPWAVIRIDGDMYESTMAALTHLYPRLEIGGYAIVDDYGALPRCRRAVDDFRRAENISEPLQWVDWTGVFWRRER